MASSSGGDGGREDLKSAFSTREGTYRLVSAVELARPRPIAYANSSPPPPAAPPVRLSFVSLDAAPPSPGSDPDLAAPHRLCLNLGKEIFIYPFSGCRKSIDMSKPIDKRVYKGTNPTCHDFNLLAAGEENLSLLIGFSGGQIQLVDPVSKEVNKLFNEERVIEKSRVTCVRWLPNSLTQFLVSHGSGHMYVYSTESACATAPPAYQVNKSGHGYSVSSPKAKSGRNPVSRWSLGDGAINEFAFSPCGTFVATVSQDGFLRIFKFETVELVGVTRSYFGGLLCVCWSPDGKYVCAGGEDDLVTIWSFKDRRVVARGQGHRSWVSVVAFDPFTTTYAEEEPCCDSVHSSGKREGLCSYRIASVGQDTQLCLWDLTDDVLKAPWGNKLPSEPSSSPPNEEWEANGAGGGLFRFPGRKGRGVGKSGGEENRLIGTSACPRLDECPLLEPLICKKISHERLTSLVFREESIVTACQDGVLCTWARPGDVVSQL